MFNGALVSKSPEAQYMMENIHSIAQTAVDRPVCLLTWSFFPLRKAPCPRRDVYICSVTGRYTTPIMGCTENTNRSHPGQVWVEKYYKNMYDL